MVKMQIGGRVIARRKAHDVGVDCMNIPMRPELKDHVRIRAKRMSRDMTKHVRRLIVDDLIGAGQLTQEQAEALT